MRVAVIGAGPAGLLVGSALARRGHEVVAVDRDAGPPADGHWPRRGVMQFHHAHGFRLAGGRGAAARVAGGVRRVAGARRGADHLRHPRRRAGAGGHRSRRDTFERALRATSADVPGLTVRQGHVDGVARRRAGGSAGSWSTAQRSRRTSSSTPPAGRAGPPTTCGRPRPSAACAAWRTSTGSTACATEPSPGRWPIRSPGRPTSTATRRIVFLHERGHFSVLLVRPTADAALKDLRHRGRVRGRLPGDPRARRVDRPGRGPSRSPTCCPGGPLRNNYRGQRGVDGRPSCPGW